MPEGDTIFRIARTLDRALSGKTVTQFETVLPALARVDDQTPLRGRRVERVSATGKHLTIEFSGPLFLRTHLRMNGSWHLYRAGERWRRPRRDMRLLIGTDDYVAVGFNIPVAEFSSAEQLPPLGPDLLGTSFDIDEAVRRLRANPDAEIGNVLLDQRVMAGLGNIYKSEVLYACGTDPFSSVASLSDDLLTRVANTARKMLRQAATGRPERRVYRRAGQPCRKCGTRIESRRQGEDARSTYWCPNCQRRVG